MPKERAELIQEALKELEPPTPRELRLSRFSEAKGLWAGTVLGGIYFIVFTGFLFYQMLTPILSCWFGTPTQGTIVGQWITHGKGTGYHLKVQYSVGEENTIGTIDVSRDIYENITIGSKVGIHYLPIFPQKPALDEYPPPIFGLLFLAAVIAGFIFYWLQLRKQKFLLIHGKAVKGRLSLVGPKIDTGTFEYKNETHRVNMPANYYRRKNTAGDEILVLFDPDNPKKYLAYDPANFYWRPVQAYEGRSKLVS